MADIFLPSDLQANDVFSPIEGENLKKGLQEDKEKQELK